VEKVLWRINRLRCMSPGEMAHRALRLARAEAERWGLFGFDGPPAADLSGAPHAWLGVPAEIDAEAVLAAANRIAAGRFDVLALRDVELGNPPRWNRDPKTGVEAPLEFGERLDYRDPQIVGDIKYLWEPNRHLHLVTLAQAYAISGQARYFGVIREHLESWFAACPFRMGANWTSALEAAIRLVNWSLAWQLLGGARSALFEDGGGALLRSRWLDSVYQHAEFVHGHFSLYSSANNHLIGEASGLFLAALAWPHWPRARVWRDAAKAILEREALLQNAPDGVNREQAVSYQQFTLDFLLLPLLAGGARGVRFGEAYQSRIEAMLEYLASIMDAGGHVPMFGDADDGYVVKLSHDSGFCPYRSLLATGGVLFRRPEFKRKAGALDDKTRWLLGENVGLAYARVDESAALDTRTAGASDARAAGRSDDARAAGKSNDARAAGKSNDARAAGLLPVRRAFPDGGYYILGSDFESEKEIRLVVDAGPLGYRSIAAHGHADALSFTLSVGGSEFLIDPGTYAYHTLSRWRGYFRGTAAHNTLRIDGNDQSQPGGNFMWMKKASAGCDVWRPGETEDLFEGWQDGYAHQTNPLMHRRRIVLDKPGRRFTIEDVLETSSIHDVEMFFHCAEECMVAPAPGGFAIRRETGTILLRLPNVGGPDVRVLRGCAAPIGGWVSRRFDEKQPACTIAWRARIASTTVLRSVIQC
jgi:hypothetical protein